LNVDIKSEKEFLKLRRDRYLELVKGGMNFTEAARCVGVSKRTGKVWRNGRTRSSGHNEAASLDWYRGDMNEPKRINSYYLSQDERISIADMLTNGFSLRAIAKHLKRSPSTISREIKNNTGSMKCYGPYRAQQLSTSKLSRPKKRKIDNPELNKEIQQKLDIHWSPEQISAWLLKTFPDNETMNVCAETIYQAIYIQAKGQLKRDVVSRLRTGRIKRKAHTSPDQRTSRFRDPMVMISERPPEVEDRAVPGHWEGDLIVGANNQSAIGTLVERTTRFTVLLHLPNGHTSIEVQDAIIKKMYDLPRLMKNSLTWDQGSELALHKKISTALDLDVYFCDPHSPWQRGTNENTNGLLRQYFPKGTDLSVYPENYLDAVAEELNDRPRKTLGWDKPSKRFVQLIEDAA
jgi:IS30 family transposase